MTRETIGGNICFTYIPSEKFKTGFFSAQMALPLTAEAAGRNALLVNVLSRGTARCPDIEALGRELDLLYGARLDPTVRKKGENQLFGFVASCVDDRFLGGEERLLEPLTALMGEMLCAPALEDGRLRSGYVAGERANLADLIRSTINDKRSYAARRLLEELCAGEPYGLSRLGTVRDVEAITAEDLDRHYRDVLPRARLELFYCGSAPQDRVREAFSAAFAALPRAGALEPVETLRHPVPEQCRTVTEEMDVAQGKLCIGYTTDSEDRMATRLMNSMFGGSATSKLFTNVREKLSLCYYAGSTYHRSKGIITVSAGIEQENYQKTLDEVNRQIEAMASGRWEDWELEAARTSLLSGLRTMEDSAGALEDYAMNRAVTGAESLEELRTGLIEVTPERVRAAAEALRIDTIYFLKGKEAQ